VPPKLDIYALVHFAADTKWIIRIHKIKNQKYPNVSTIPKITITERVKFDTLNTKLYYSSLYWLGSVPNLAGLS
jgi:hypothetical protein